MARKNSKAEGGAATLELPTSSSPNSLRVENVQISQIIPSGRNHRIHEDGIDELAASMAVNGLEQPIKVTRCGGGSANGFTLVFGHRRLAAARKLRWNTIPAIVVDLMTPPLIANNRAIENLQRADLNPIEAALAVGEIMDEELAAARKRGGLADDQEPTADVADTLRQAALKRVSERIGKPVRWVRDHVFLGTLDKTTRELVVNGKLPWEHARELAKVADIEKRAEIAKRAAIGHGYREQPMTMRDLRYAVAPHLRSLSGVNWKLDVEFAGAPACSVCPQNSKNQSGLFDHNAPLLKSKTGYGTTSTQEPEAGVCLNAACFGRKSGLANRQMSNAAKKVQLTVSAAPKAEREKVQKTTVAKLAPAVVKPAAFAAAVKDKLESKATAKTAAASSSKSRTETPEAKAKREHALAVDFWESDFMSKAVSAIREINPEIQALLLLINMDDRVHACRYGRASPSHIKAIRELLYLAATPTQANFEKLVGALKLPKRAMLEIFEGCDFGELLQSVFPFEFKKPKPKLEDFLPKASAEKASKPAKGKKPAKSHGPEGPLGYCYECMEKPAVEDMDGVRLCASCLEDLK